MKPIRLRYGVYVGVVLLALFAIAFVLSGSSKRRSDKPKPPDLPQLNLPSLDPAVAGRLDRLQRQVERKGDAASWGELGMFYWAHQLNEPAEQCFAMAETLESAAFRWTYYRAVLAEQLDWELAEQLYKAALKKENDYAPAYWRLGNLLLQRGEFAVAAHAFEQAKALEPKSPYPLLGIARAAGPDSRQLQETLLREAAQLAPTSRQVARMLAAVLHRQGESDEALQWLLTAESHPPDSPTMPDPLVAEVREYEVLARHDARSADEAFLSGRFDVAAKRFQQLLRKRPGWTRAQLGLARSLLNLQRIEDAQRLLEQSLTESPDNAEAYELLGQIAQARGDVDAARDHFERAVQLQPTLASAQFTLGLLHDNQGRLDRAIEHYQAAVAASPEFPSAQLALGAALLRNGQPQQSLAPIRNAQRLAPNNPMPARFLEKARSMLPSPDESAPVQPASPPPSSGEGS